MIQSPAIDGGLAVSVDEAAARVHIAGNANFPLSGFDDTHILDAFVSAYSFDGDPQGSRQYPGTTNMDQANAICASSLGVVTVGLTQSRLDDPSAPPRGSDAFVEIVVSGR